MCGNVKNEQSTKWNERKALSGVMWEMMWKKRRRIVAIARNKNNESTEV